MGNLFSSEGDRQNQQPSADIKRYDALKAQQKRDREAAEYQQQLRESAALKAVLELQQRRLEEALKRKRERKQREQREQAEYRQRWPSLHDQPPPSPSYTQPNTRSLPHRGAFLDSWEDWESWENDTYYSQTSPTAVSDAHEEDVDLSEWRKRRAANKNQMKGRRVRGRNPKGDLFEDDYHAGHTKDEIKSMCRERQASFEASALKKASTQKW